MSFGGKLHLCGEQAWWPYNAVQNDDVVGTFPKIQFF